MKHEGRKNRWKAAAVCGLIAAVVFLGSGLTAQPPESEIKPLDKLIEPDAPSIGPEDAPVVIVEFTDFQCTYCSQISRRLEAIREADPDRIRIVFMDRPLIEPMNDGYPFHPFAMIAHAAAAEALVQGKFWEMKRYIFNNQGVLFRLPRPLNQAEWSRQLMGIQVRLVTASGALGMDKKKMEQALTDHRHREKIMERVKKAQDMGIDSTPTIYVNGKNMEANLRLIRAEVEKLLEEDGK